MLGAEVGHVNWWKTFSEKMFIRSLAGVRKGDDPHGRIVHDFSYANKNGESVNSALIENSVQYIAFKDRVHALAQVS